ncbi:DsrE family protein [Zeaxanthinibacter sp. PT1]|uniref:DsrE family protein n=1 Tax=Zeaxanthinibacter TaxID=561554 RepID=UPI002349B65F|nr:DsrE family protein [Zeaxanthinibacter sp. PT1]MDC6351421.1 DsrE family protein [Zeaxanthinibacter sp. PT1]
MKRQTFLLLILALLFMVPMTNAQQAKAGPVIKNYGKVYPIANPGFNTNTSLDFNVVFDVTASPENKEELNKSIETAARFLNMHAQAGVPVSQLSVAMVVHGSATLNMIDNKAYEKRYGIPNPNEPLIRELLNHGVQIIQCGQSINGRGVAREELIPGVQLALSAMTALIQLQGDGYRLIKF